MKIGHVLAFALILSMIAAMPTVQSAASGQVAKEKPSENIEPGPWECADQDFDAGNHLDYHWSINWGS